MNIMNNNYKLTLAVIISFLLLPLKGLSIGVEPMKHDVVVAFYHVLEEGLKNKYPEYTSFLTPIYCTDEHCRFDITIPVINLRLIKGYISGFQNSKNGYKLINIVLKTVPELFPSKLREDLEIYYLYDTESDFVEYFSGEKGKEKAFHKMETYNKNK